MDDVSSYGEEKEKKSSPLPRFGSSRGNASSSRQKWSGNQVIRYTSKRRNLRLHARQSKIHGMKLCWHIFFTFSQNEAVLKALFKISDDKVTFYGSCEGCQSEVWFEGIYLELHLHCSRWVMRRTLHLGKSNARSGSVSKRRGVLRILQDGWLCQGLPPHSRHLPFLSNDKRW